MKQFFFVLVIILLFASCKTRYVTLHEVEHRTDSITLVDTVVEVRLDVVHDSVAVEVTDTASSYLSNKYAYSWARYIGGRLHHSLGIYEGLTPIRLNMPKEYVTVVKYKDVPVPVEQPLTTIQRIQLRWFNFISCMALMMFIIIVCLLKRK